MAKTNYLEGFDYGVGVESLTGEIRGDAVVRSTPTEIQGAQGQKWALSLDQIDSTTELYESLGISAKVDVTWGLFGGSAQFNFAKKSTFNSYSLFLIVSMVVENAFRQMRDVQLNNDAISLLQNGYSETFRQRYGDTFIRGFSTGGEFFSILEIMTNSETEKTDISSELKASYGTFLSVEGKFEKTLSESLTTKKISITSYAKGGDENVPQTLEEIIAKARNFPSTVAGDRAVPYRALLVDYRTLAVPGQPTWLETQAAREALENLEYTRRSLMRFINDIDYVLLNQKEFPGLNNDKINQLNNKREELYMEVNKIMTAASRCASNLKDCKLETLAVPDLSLLTEFEIPERVHTLVQEPIKPRPSGPGTRYGNLLRTIGATPNSNRTVQVLFLEEQPNEHSKPYVGDSL